MSLGFFCEKCMLPSENEVSSVLENMIAIWNDVKLYIGKYGLIKEEWKFYSKKAGWCKKIFLVSNKEERNIIFLYPNINCITCVLVFGEKAVFAAQRSKLPDDILNNILSAKQYREGRSFNVEIRTLQDYEVLKKLIEIKIMNSTN